MLSARGPEHGVPQMVLSRLGFGYRGNILPAGLNSITAGIGWFAVNSVSGTFALNTLTHLPKILCLIIIVAAQLVIAFFGHNLVHAFERYAFPVLAVIFLVATVVILAKSHPGAVAHPDPRRVPAQHRRSVRLRGRLEPLRGRLHPLLPAQHLQEGDRLVVGGRGIHLLRGPGGRGRRVGHGRQCCCLARGPDRHVHRPPAHRRWPTLTLLAIALGAVCANVLNIYSGAMSFVAIGIKLPLALRRAIVALVFGAIGFIVAITGLHDAGARYTNFLLIIAYWIAPWLAVMFCDQFLYRRRSLAEEEGLLFNKQYSNWAGPVAMLVGMVVSVWLFSNQTEYIGLIPKHVPAVGDITFEVGFVLTAVVYLTWHAIAGSGAGSRAAAKAS